jgi:hypothetical protein
MLIVSVAIPSNGNARRFLHIVCTLIRAPKHSDFSVAKPQVQQNEIEISGLCLTENALRPNYKVKPVNAI